MSENATVDAATGGNACRQAPSTAKANKGGGWALRKLTCPELRFELMRRGLEVVHEAPLGEGREEMRVFSSAFHPPADTHLWVQPDGVLFDLRLRVTVVAPTIAGATPGGAEEAHTLPAGLAIICCDDDDIPRIFASTLLASAAADEGESLILGETYEEVAGLVDRVLEMAARLGDERVLCILDQNLDRYDQGAFTGTEIARQLRARGFGGLVVIQSANDELADQHAYVAAGADGSTGKGGIKGLLGMLGRLHLSKFGAPPGSEAIV